MPNWLWMLLCTVVLVVIAVYIDERLIKVLFYVLAFVMAVMAVLRLSGRF